MNKCEVLFVIAIAYAHSRKILHNYIVLQLRKFGDVDANAIAI
ncbi:MULTISPECIES: hypothetical protein [unclassified Calothrix]|nr:MULTISPECIES: hypothetical protein [unclassified Calothrix]